MSQSPSPDVATAVAGVRASMAELDVAIAALRTEATRLRSTADAAMSVALLERPADEDVPAFGIDDASADSDTDTDSDVDTDDAPVDRLVAVEEDLPAFGAFAPSEPGEPTAAEPTVVEPEPAEPTAAESEPAEPAVEPTITEPDVDPAAIEADAGVATVLEFPTGAEVVEPVAGAPTIGDTPAEPTEAPLEVADGLAAIEDTESTDMPDDWDEDDADAEAFEKFFSDDVEPEPAQRWLLNDL